MKRFHPTKPLAPAGRRTFVTEYLIAAVCSVGLVKGNIFAASVAAGAAVRLFTLPLTALGDRYLFRYAEAIPEMLYHSKKFNEIVDDRTTLRVEVTLALEEFVKEMNLILRRHGTSQQALVWPPVVSSLVAFDAFRASATIVSALGVTSCGGAPWFAACAATGAAISTWNTRTAMKKRLGFSNRRDVIIERLLVGNWSQLIVGALLSLGIGLEVVSLEWALLGPMWLGGALVGTLYHSITRLRAARRILDIPELPNTHGTYGNSIVRFSMQEILDMRAKQEDDEIEVVSKSEGVVQLRENPWKNAGLFASESDYQHVKQQLDYECNLKYTKFRRLFGLRSSGSRDPDLDAIMAGQPVMTKNETYRN
jgi:hypothetical protein